MSLEHREGRLLQEAVVQVSSWGSSRRGAPVRGRCGSWGTAWSASSGNGAHPPHEGAWAAQELTLAAFVGPELTM